MKPLPAQFKRFIVSLFIFCCVIVTPFGFVSSSAAYSVPSDTIVYITPTGSKYHRYKCTYTSTVSSMTIAAAEQAGYGPCSRCRPDIRTGTYTPGAKTMPSSPSSSVPNSSYKSPQPTPSSSYKSPQPTPTPAISNTFISSPQSTDVDPNVLLFVIVVLVGVLFIAIYLVPKAFERSEAKWKQQASKQYDDGLRIGYAQAKREFEEAAQQLQSERNELSLIRQQISAGQRELQHEYSVLEQHKNDFERELKKKAAPIARKKSSDYIISLLKATSLNNHFSGSRVFRAIADSSNKDLLARFESAQTKTIHFADSINVFTRMYGSKGEVYEVSLDSCTCPDFTRRKVGACKHMLKLALELSLLTSDENDSPKAK